MKQITDLAFVKEDLINDFQNIKEHSLKRTMDTDEGVYFDMGCYKTIEPFAISIQVAVRKTLEKRGLIKKNGTLNLARFKKDDGNSFVEFGCGKQKDKAFFLTIDPEFTNHKFVHLGIPYDVKDEVCDIVSEYLLSNNPYDFYGESMSIHIKGMPIVYQTIISNMRTLKFSK